VAAALTEGRTPPDRVGRIRHGHSASVHPVLLVRVASWPSRSNGARGGCWHRNRGMEYVVAFEDGVSPFAGFQGRVASTPRPPRSVGGKFKRHTPSTRRVRNARIPSCEKRASVSTASTASIHNLLGNVMVARAARSPAFTSALRTLPPRSCPPTSRSWQALPTLRMARGPVRNVACERTLGLTRQLVGS
jgi:hypothetical protein